jgi:hypothetical protein
MARNATRCSVFLTVLLVLSACLPLFAGGGSQSEPKATTGHLRVAIVDRKTVHSAYARCYLTNSAGESLKPNGVLAYQRLPEKHFVTSGEFLVDLPPGKYTLRVERGPEYKSVTRGINIQSDETIDAKVEVTRWIDMNNRQWYSGDLHLHRDWREMPQIMLAEDLNLATDITDWFALDHLVSSGPAPAETVQGVHEIDALHTYSILNAEVERPGRAGLGTVNLIAADEPIAFQNAYLLGPPDSVFAEQAHKKGGYVDLEKLLYADIPALVALGHGDFAQILYNWFSRDGVIQVDPSEAGMVPRTDPQYSSPAGMPLWAMDIYYRFLNCGFKLPVSAGTASGVLPSPPGYNRVYVKLPGKFEYRAWFKALQSGRSFATSGPILFLKVKGHEPGDTIQISRPAGKDTEVLDVHAEATSANALDRIEIVWKGKVVKTVVAKQGASEAKVDFKLHPKESGWIVARAFEKTVQPLPNPTTHPVLINGYQPISDVSKHGWATAPYPHFAHTGPVFVQIGSDQGVVPADAQFFIDWIDREIPVFESVTGFRSESDRQQVLTMFRQARSVYQKLASGSEGQ